MGEWLEQMFDSLERANMPRPRIVMSAREDGGVWVGVWPWQEFPKEGWPALKSFIKNYSAAAGWKVTQVRKIPGDRYGFEISASRA